jgi:4'-phosphopantetheinyl transferase
MMENAVSIVDARQISDLAVANFAAWLDDEETARHRKFVRRERQRQFVIGRALLRHELGKLLGVSARSIKLTERPASAPILAWPRVDRIGLSISHSGPWVACAVSASTPVGLDIEVIDPTRDVAALAQQAFSVREVALLASRPNGTRLRDFYEMWCTHEARIKLGLDVHHSYVLPHPDVAAVLCSVHPLITVPELAPASLPH